MFVFVVRFWVVFIVVVELLFALWWYTWFGVVVFDLVFNVSVSCLMVLLICLVIYSRLEVFTALVFELFVWVVGCGGMCILWFGWFCLGVDFRRFWFGGFKFGLLFGVVWFICCLWIWVLGKFLFGLSGCILVMVGFVEIGTFGCFWLVFVWCGFSVLGRILFAYVWGLGELVFSGLWFRLGCLWFWVSEVFGCYSEICGFWVGVLLRVAFQGLWVFCFSLFWFVYD